MSLPELSGLISHQDIKFGSKRGKKPASIFYISSFALKIAAKANLNLTQIVALITRQMVDLQTDCNSSFAPESISPPVWPHFTIQSQQSGLLKFELTDLGVAIWLDQLASVQTNRNWNHQQAERSPATARQLPFTATAPQKVSPNAWSQSGEQVGTAIWAAQYVHHRTASLLRLASRSGLRSRAAEKQLISVNRANWHFPPSHHYPWLDEQKHLRLQHASEWELIRYFITLTDEWETCQRSYTPQEACRHIELLAQCFEQFYRQCRVFGDVAQQTPELAHARLGLIQITQNLMGILLEEGLGVEALTQL